MQIVRVVKAGIESGSTLLTTGRPVASVLIIASVSILFYLPILWAEFVYDDLGQIVTPDYSFKAA
jgi:hypothetical protein